MGEVDEVPEEPIEIVETEKSPEEIAEAQGLTGTDMKGAYTQETPMGKFIYIWDPEAKEFKSFTLADDAEDTEADFTPDGRVIDRNDEEAVKAEAMLAMQNQGFNVNPNGTYPFSVEKDGILYEYNKETGEYEEVKAEVNT